MDVFILFSQGLGLYGEEQAEKAYNPEVMDDSKETVASRHKRTDTHNTHRGCNSTHKISTDSNQTISQKGKWTQSPTPNQASVVDSCQQKENQFLPTAHHWILQPHSGQEPWPGAVDQHKQTPQKGGGSWKYNTVLATFLISSTQHHSNLERERLILAHSLRV